ncbi:hypothetical protein ACN9ML_18730 [Dyadobacter endophyticus]
MKAHIKNIEERKREVLSNPRVQAIINEKVESARKLVASGALDNFLNKKS